MATLNPTMSLNLSERLHNDVIHGNYVIFTHPPSKVQYQGAASKQVFFFVCLY